VNIELYHINPDLRNYIKCICSIENSHIESKVPFRIFPDTCVEIFISYTDYPLASIKGKNNFEEAGSLATFRMDQYTDVVLLPSSGCIAICFQPGAAHYFFDIPMSELANLTLNMELLWRERINELQDKISACKNNMDRVFLIQKFLLDRVHKVQRERNDFEYCLWQLNLFKTKAKIRDIVNKINISQRQLNRQFNQFLGLTPLEFTRVNRFMNVIEMIRKSKNLILTEVAYESGYYDQSHFIHECRRLAGLTPGELIRSVCFP
jgi:AraC-like DNA-binding protein